MIIRRLIDVTSNGDDEYRQTRTPYKTIRAIRVSVHRARGKSEIPAV